MECYILAGGKSGRFGEDKTLFNLLGKPMISHVVERALLVCEKVYVVCKDRQKYDFLKGVSLLEDKGKEQMALMGVLTALDETDKDRVLIMPADMPFVKPSLLRMLYESSKPPVSVFKVKDRLYPFPGVYYKVVLKELRDYLSSHHRSVMGFLEMVGYTSLPVEESSLSFLNINTKEDLGFILNTMERRLLVKGMTCEHCVNTVKRALFDVEGVSHVEVDLQKGEVKLYTETDVPFERLKDAIERWGYSVVGEV